MIIHHYRENLQPRLVGGSDLETSIRIYSNYSHSFIPFGDIMPALVGKQRQAKSPESLWVIRVFLDAVIRSSTVSWLGRATEAAAERKYAAADSP